jgi:sigma-B regulation protein RsbU (phosphoserine phosphatase)
MFVTLFFGILDLAKGRLAYAQAAHEPPLWITSERGVELDETRRGSALALGPAAHYETEERRLQPGDLLLLYSDGVTEAQDAKEEWFSSTRLLQLAVARRGEPLPDLVDDLLEATREFCGAAPQFDDIAILALRYRGAGERREWKVENDLALLPSLLEGMSAFFTAQRVAPAIVSDLHLALEEIVSNVMMHGYGAAAGTIAVAGSVSTRRVVVEVRDRGVAFDPLQAPPPDLELPVDERPIGGLGILLARELMDEVRYERRTEENVLWLVRYLRME